MPGRLNSFQRTMLQWNDLHPYNAVHVARIPVALDASTLQAAIESALKACGTGTLALNRDKGTFHYESAVNASAPTIINIEHNLYETLRVEIERQLNTPFPGKGYFSPFRFFVVPEANSFSLGIAYFHPVADAVSIVYLMKAIAHRYQGKPSSPDPGTIEIYPRSHDNVFFRHPGLLFRKFSAMWSVTRNLRRSFRPPSRDAQNLHNHCDFFSLPPGALAKLSRAAKSQGATLNDLLLAVLLKTVSPFASRRWRSQRRQKLSVGCIVNLRSDLGLDSPHMFGLFLGSFIVTHDVPEDIELMQLAREVRLQTAAVKKHRLYLGTSIEMTFGRILLSFFSTDRRKKLYQKHYPLWGGITNMNLNSIWQQSGDEPIDYFRAVSTGPVTPLVLSITTVNDTMNVSITSRANAFAKADIEQIKRSFLKTVEQLEVSA